MFVYSNQVSVFSWEVNFTLINKTILCNNPRVYLTSQLTASLSS